jgi:prolyl-tRNA synthetase
VPIFAACYTLKFVRTETHALAPDITSSSKGQTGANADGKHAAFVVRARDFTPDGEIGAVEIRDGDRCARCGSPLQIGRGIELGHIFQLGRKYADTFGLTAVRPDGKPLTVTMGSYGIGITRAVAALAEQTYDDKGLRWPRAVAPADVHLVATGKDEMIFATAEALALGLQDAGLGVLYDDRRGVSPGVKFNDAELLGMPTIVVVGQRLADGIIELRDRHTDHRIDIPAADAAARITAAIG